MTVEVVLGHLRPWLVSASILCILLSIVQIVSVNLSSDAIFQTRDFMPFWLIGKAVLDGRANTMYPAVGATHFDFSPTQTYFLYPPQTALVSVLLAVMPVRVSFLVLQILSVVALWLAAWLFARIHWLSFSTANNAPSTMATKLFLGSFALLTVAQTISIGQPGLIVNFLPLIAGYFLLVNNKFALAGIVWSFIGLKPQPLEVVVPIMVALAAAAFSAGEHAPFSRKQVGRLAAGFAGGLIVQAAVPLAMFGFDLCRRWLDSMRLFTEYVYGTQSYFEPMWLLCSVLGLLARTLPAGLRHAAHLPSTIASGLFLIVEVLVLTLIARRPIGARQKLAAMLAVAVLFMPLVALYMRLYDLTLMLAPAWILLSKEGQAVFGRLKYTVPLAAVLIDVYYLTMPWQVTAQINVQCAWVLVTFLVVLCVLTCKGSLDGGSQSVA